MIESKAIRTNLTGAANGNFEPSIARKPQGGPSFGKTLEKISTPEQLSHQTAGVGANSQLLRDPVKFSNHAVDRMMSRGIKFSPQDLERLTEAVGRAQAKGSRDSLILLNETALIVSVKNNTVVTVMDKNALKENVFTNIDSTIVM